MTPARCRARLSIQTHDSSRSITLLGERARTIPSETAAAHRRPVLQEPSIFPHSTLAFAGQGRQRAVEFPILVITEPAAELGRDYCVLKIYKDPKDIPAHYYERLGLTKPAAES